MTKKFKLITLIFILSLLNGQFSLYGEYSASEALGQLGSFFKKAFMTCSLLDANVLFVNSLNNPQLELEPTEFNNLLACGAQVNIVPTLADNTRKLTPLMMLLLNHGRKSGIADIVKSFLSHGAEVNARALYGETPLYYAIKYSTPQIVEMLLEAGADVNAQISYDDSSPLHAVFSKQGALDEKGALVKSLIAHGANPKLKDKEGVTPLHLILKERLSFNATDSAVYSKNFTDQLMIIRELLRAGADMNAQNISEETPLMFAAYYNADPNIIRFLLINGANKTIKNKFGRTVTDILHEELKDQQYEQLPHYADNMRAILDAMSQIK